MKNVFIAMLLLLTASICWAAETYTYTFPDGKAVISFPNKFSVTKMEADEGTPKHTVTRMLDSRIDGGPNDPVLGFQLMAMDYDYNVANTDLSDVPKRNNGINADFTDFEGRKSVYFEIKSPAKNGNKAIFIATRYILVGNRSYVLTFDKYGDNVELTDSDVKTKQEFFSSFHIKSE